jgi:hypothetical protein
VRDPTQSASIQRETSVDACGEESGRERKSAESTPKETVEQQKATVMEKELRGVDAIWWEWLPQWYRLLLVELPHRRLLQSIALTSASCVAR